MGVPTWEVGYTSAIPRREDHEVRQGHVGHWIKKKNKKNLPVSYSKGILTNRVTVSFQKIINQT